MMKRYSREIIAGGILMLACAGGLWAADARAPVHAASAVSTAAAAAKTQPAAAPAAAPGAPAVQGAAAAAEAYRYQPAGKSDPFKPFMATEPVPQTAKDAGLKKKGTATGRFISPLQQAEISQFRLVGIAGDETRRMAIVEDGVAKKNYPLFVGTAIGPNEGRVVSILPDRVIIEERSLTDDKKMQVERITVMLHKEE